MIQFGPSRPSDHSESFRKKVWNLLLQSAKTSVKSDIMEWAGRCWLLHFCRSNSSSIDSTGMWCTHAIIAKQTHFHYNRIIYGIECRKNRFLSYTIVHGVERRAQLSPARSLHEAASFIFIIMIQICRCCYGFDTAFFFVFVFVFSLPKPFHGDQRSLTQFRRYDFLCFVSPEAPLLAKFSGSWWCWKLRLTGSVLGFLIVAICSSAIFN